MGKDLPPNGWEFTLSNEVYYDHEGTSYEAVGVPPDVAATVFSLKDLDAGRNSALETALDTLANGSVGSQRIGID